MSKYANVYGNRPNTKSCTSFPVRGFLVDTTAYAVLSLNIFLIASVEYDLGRSRAASIFGEACFYNNEVGALTSTERTIPDKLCSNAECARNTEEYGVVVHLVETIVGQEHTGVRVDVRPGVLSLASLSDCQLPLASRVAVRTNLK